MIGNSAYLIIKKGDMFEKGSIVLLPAGTLCIGRAWEENEPDIPFTSPYVSKKHALIEIKDDLAILTDTMSKHGTSVNGNKIGCNAPYRLQDGDEINLARGEVLFMFYSAGQDNIGVTRDFSSKSCQLMKYDDPTKGIVIYEERHQVFINGTSVKLAGKDMQLLLLLYKNRQKAVSYNEIKSAVWPERIPINGVPDVGNEEIVSLAHRLRKKIGDQGNRIQSLAKYGYMLDLS